MKKISSGMRAVSILIFVVLFGGSVAVAQISPSTRPVAPPPPRPVDGSMRPRDERPLTTFEEEMRAKRLIKMAEKDHEDNLKRAREIAQIGKELQETLKDKSAVDRDSLKKVERLEKLTKKIRSEAGGDDEQVTIDNKPADLCGAVTQIAQASESLSKNVQDTPRQVVSASVIGKANVLLELLKMVRGFVSR
jgi:Rieske Fe-S protein